MVMLGRSDVRANVLHGWEPEMRITVTTIQSNTLNPPPFSLTARWEAHRITGSI